jgi:hypothetical protein
MFAQHEFNFYSLGGIVNHSIFITIIASVAVFCCASFSYAAEVGLYGQRIIPSVNIQAKLTDESSQTVCIPAGTVLEIIGEKGDDIYVKLLKDKKSSESPVIQSCTIPSSTNKTIDCNLSYTIEKNTYETRGFARSGATYGALVVPFKYQLTKDKEFSGGSTIGAYAGYRFEWLNRLGFTAVPIVFGGASNISVNSGGNNKSVMGFSYGLGLIGTYQTFQSGVVLGWDRVGKNEGYMYNGKPWIAVQVGYSFAQ